MAKCIESQINVAEGAVRAGKTVDNVFAFAYLLERTPDKLHLASGSTGANAKLNIGYANGYGLEAIFRGRYHWGKYKDNEAMFVRDGYGRDKVIIFAGGGKNDSFKKIRGNSYGMWIATEINLHADSFIKEAMNRQLAAVQRKIFWDLNPDHPKAKIYKDYLDSYAAKAAKGELIGGYNYTSNGTVTYYQTRVVVGRSNGWTEKDFASDITGGEDFMENVAVQISDYKYEVDQDTLLSIMKGVFAMKSAEGLKFVSVHTYDITAAANSEGKTGLFDATTMNTAMQRACGDKKSKFTMAIMHSSVATNLENLKLLTYAKYNDGNGMERDIQIATVNGRLVLIDDAMPVNNDGEKPVYTTYVFGDGAIEHTDCGVKVPIEMARDAKTNGGQDTLYMRQRKCFAPWGISFTKASMASPSPTDEELEKGENWDIVNGQDKDGNTVYIPHKTIPLCQILSLG